jgi:hypothetical protein
MTQACLLETFEKHSLLPNLPPSLKASAFAKGYGGTGWQDKRRQAQILILEILKGMDACPDDDRDG